MPCDWKNHNSKTIHKIDYYSTCSHIQRQNKKERETW